MNLETIIFRFHVELGESIYIPRTQMGLLVFIGMKRPCFPFKKRGQLGPTVDDSEIPNNPWLDGAKTKK